MAQTLACLLTVTDLAPRASVTVSHVLEDHRGALVPDHIQPLCSTAIGVTARDEVGVTFFNYGDTTLSATFLCAYNHSVQGGFGNAGVWTGGRLPGSTLWGSLNHVVYGNSDVETSLLDPAGAGSLTLPAGLFVEGRVLRYEARGILSCGNGQQTRFKLRVNGYDLIDSLGTLPNNLSDAYIEAQFDIFCHHAGVHGQLDGSGRSFIQTANGITTVAMRPLIGSDIVVDTTQAMAFDHRYQWIFADPGNTVTIQRAHLRVLA